MRTYQTDPHGQVPTVTWRQWLDLFQRAGGRAPAIVFIDEIDALGTRRNARSLIGNDEREQTLDEKLEPDVDLSQVAAATPREVRRIRWPLAVLGWS